MSNRITNIITAFFLIVMFFLAVFSMKGDSCTMDEVAHLPAGYSYLTQKDMRLNPEHPPLVKDLAAFPLLFMKGINFPSEIKPWQDDVNGQWDFGFNFFYHSNNPADQMLFWSRIPMILMLLLLGFYIFRFGKEFFGPKAGLLALFLFSFSPTFLAHGRLVTTDVGAATGVVISTFYFLKALKNPEKKNLILAGLAFGFAQLLKFSAILLAPLFVFLTFVWWLTKRDKWQDVLRTLILIFVIGFSLVWLVYQYHVWNYPPERQVRDTEFLLGSTSYPIVRGTLVWAADKPILRPLAQYLLGLALVFQRVSGGNTTYFLGEVSAAGWKIYFPLVYLVKETLTFHILTLISIFYLFWLIIKKPFWQNTFQKISAWLKEHFAEFAMVCFVILYWLTSLKGNLNIGARHLMPVFPFTFLLVSSLTVSWLKSPFLKLKYLFLTVLILWQVISVLKIYPHFLAYFNELAGGPDQGYFLTVDSNLDWGQDLKRLKTWVEENKIEKIYVDYFGGGDAQYYLKEKFVPWWGTRDPQELPKGSYLAVSATFLQGGRGKPVPGFNQSYGYYHWLDNQKLVAKIGYSIFIYQIN